MSDTPNDPPLKQFIVDLTKGRPLRPNEIIALLRINGFKDVSASYITQVQKEVRSKSTTRTKNN